MQSFVVVKQFPESMVASGAQEFFQELQPILGCKRPSLVFDFSRVSDFDGASIDTLLRCLGEVMKRDGDLKLAALTPRTATILELTKIDRLFQIFTYPSEAVKSFAYCPVEAERQSRVPHSFGSFANEWDSSQSGCEAGHRQADS